MKHIALLRGVNAGGLRRVEMGELRGVFARLGLGAAQTVLNSGNVVFSADGGGGAAAADVLRGNIEAAVKKTFNLQIPVLVLAGRQLSAIAAAIPAEWKNDAAQRTDVAFLFPEINSKKILGELPFNGEYIRARYARGALFWNLQKKHYNKSRLGKIIGEPAYQFMTLRNVNTVRRLAAIVQAKVQTKAQAKAQAK